jgi:hypothetical protein
VEGQTLDALLPRKGMRWPQALNLSWSRGRCLLARPGRWAPARPASAKGLRRFCQPMEDVRVSLPNLLEDSDSGRLAPPKASGRWKWAAVALRPDAGAQFPLSPRGIPRHALW